MPSNNIVHFTLHSKYFKIFYSQPRVFEWSLGIYKFVFHEIYSLETRVSRGIFREGEKPKLGPSCVAIFLLLWHSLACGRSGSCTASICCNKSRGTNYAPCQLAFRVPRPQMYATAPLCWPFSR